LNQAEDYLSPAWFAPIVITKRGCFGCFGRRLFAARFFLFLLVDPGMSHICNFGDREQVVSPERIARFPSVSILVDAAKLHVEARPAAFNFVSPDCGLDCGDRSFILFLVAII
jgi:hypothetical protein